MTSTPATDSDDLAAHLRRLEEALLRPDVRRSSELVALLADDFIEFASSGRVYSRADLVEALQAETPSAQTASGFRCTPLAPDAALLTYRLRRDGAPPVYTLRSSVWQRRGGVWQMVFHQATLSSVPPG